jgi:hypothetical protein
MSRTGYQLTLPLDGCLPGTTDLSLRSDQKTRSSGKPSEPHGKRLFVPLSIKPYEWFLCGRKAWELRKCARQFTPDHIRIGRPVELRLGYARPERSLWGQIVDVVIADSLADFFDRVDWRQVLPDSIDREHAERSAREILRLDANDSRPVIGFRVDLENTRATTAQE